MRLNLECTNVNVVCRAFIAHRPVRCAHRECVAVDNDPGILRLGRNGPEVISVSGHESVDQGLTSRPRALAEADRKHKPFLDTNVLVYTFGQRDDRTPIAEALLTAGAVISVQVLNELAAVARRKLKMPWSDVAAALEAIKVLCPAPLPLALATHETALRLAVAHDFHIYDALIIAAALESECTTLYSEDLHAGQVIDGRLTIRNPFPN
jgi:predicted nucleic acid-binding protein